MLPLVVAECPALSSAVTCTEPGATPVRSPAELMVANAGLVVLQVTGGVTLPDTVNCSVLPRTISPLAGETEIWGVALMVIEPLTVVAAGLPSLKRKPVRVSDVPPPLSSAGLRRKSILTSDPAPESAVTPAALSATWPLVKLAVGAFHDAAAGNVPAVVTLVAVTWLAL